MHLVAQEQKTAAEDGSSEVGTVQLPEFVLSDERVANKTPASTFAAPVSLLRFEPQVDLQTRNFGEAQGDISIRGGIFEGTAVQVGGMTLFDPQTGHYTAELPIPERMLGAPSIRTGVDHAWGGFQAAVGSVAYPWRRIEAGGEASVAVGNGDLRRYSIHAAEVVVDEPDEHRRVGVEVAWARSAADGTIENGDHDFERAAARVQLSSRLGQTELFGGYQDKFFGWPNLYTPFNWPETEHIQTALFVLAHRQQVGEGTFEAGVYHRRNDDDYEADRRQPGRFNPYQHLTEVTGGFVRYRTNAGAWRLDLRAEGAVDSLESTALTFGHFMTRSYTKLGAALERDFEAGAGVLSTRFGATWDDTNRDGSALSPLAGISWTPSVAAEGVVPRLYAEYSHATRVPGYTVLNSNPAGGLFRGNPNLGRETSRNAELGGELRSEDWAVRAAVFVRDDDPLVDWTYSAAASNARTANAVDIRTTGVELLASRTFGAFDLVASYAFLEKKADYGTASVDASFYALNFPVHRLTFAVVARLGGGVEVRCDNEYRRQEENSLRTVGGDDAFLSSLGLSWVIPRFDALELAVTADNLWQSDFQELPGVPAPGRQVTMSVTYRW